MEVKTIYVNYDIRRMRPPNLIAFTHENDKNTQVIELHLTDGDEPMTLAADYTYTAAIVNSDTKALINDSIDCELNSDGNVLIPIDDLHVRGRQSLKIELTVTDEQGEQVLSLPFPIWVKVSGSILDNAQVTPESEGTVPELLEEAKEALENAGDYESLENKPQINGHELVGNKSSDDLGLQNKLTAGENITINANGEISAVGGTDDYNDLNHKPYISNSIAPGKRVELKDTLQLSNEFDINTQNEGFIFLHLQDNSISYKRLATALKQRLLYRVPFGTTLPVNLNQWADNDLTKNIIAVIDNKFYSYPVLPAGILDSPCVIISSLDNSYSYDHYGFQIIVTRNNSNVPRMFLRYKHSAYGATLFTEWREIGEKGDKGDPGDDYVLTPQDKSDIADLVLSELPTTQGVQYGNTSN